MTVHNPIPQTIDVTLDQLSLRTERLTVRPLCIEDYDLWQHRWSTLPPPPNKWTNPNKTDTSRERFEETLRKRHEAFEQDTDYNFAVFVHTPSAHAPDEHRGAFVGFVQLMDISRRIFQNAYLGYSFFPQFWRHGYAFEACEAVFTCAFTTLRLHRLEAGIDPDNLASRALAARLGMTLECISPRRIFIDDAWCDMCIYSRRCEDT